MKVHLLLFVFILFIISVSGQDKTTLNGSASITGKVKAAVSGNPLEYATITLLDSAGIKTINGTTSIRVELSFDKKGDMEKILKTGFEQGFSTGLDQLEELLSN